MGTNSVSPRVMMGPKVVVSPETDSYVLATESSELHILMAALLQGINETVNNLLANRTNTRDNLEYFYFYRTEQLTFLWIIFTVIVVGNVSVLGALLLSKSKKSRMNFFIMQLAIADLSVGLTNVLTDIIWKMTIDFHGGNILCKIIKFLQVLVTYGSTYVLVALSIDRYDAITHPMNFSGSWKRARILVASAWGTSALLSVPALFLNQEKFINGRCQCWIELEEHEWQIYITLVAVSLFFIPALIISACYGIIVYTIWTKSKIMAYPKLTKTSTLVKGHNETLKKKNKADDVEHKRASSRGIIPKAKIKTVKMTFVIVFVFVLCWSPYFVYDLLQVYGYIDMSQTSIAISTFIQSLAPLNSAANPVIYCLFSTQLCRNLRRLPLCNWMAEHLCWCWPSVRRMTRSGSLQRPTEYSTMTETAMSRSSGRSSANSQRIQLHSCRNAPVNKSLSLSRKKTLEAYSSGGRSTSINASFAPNHSAPSSTVILNTEDKSTVDNSFV